MPLAAAGENGLSDSRKAFCVDVRFRWQSGDGSVMTLCLLLTHSGHRPDRNPAVQWSPGLGKIGEDGIERVTTQTVFDILEVPQSSRGRRSVPTAGKADGRAGVENAVRVRGLTRRLRE